MILNFGGVFVYAYLYVRYRVNKRAISKRQAVWEMIYAVLSIYAVAISIYLAILAVYVFLALCVIYFALNIALGRSVSITDEYIYVKTPLWRSLNGGRALESV